jgi:protein-S-isoprenylcysteine O-methyltransferase Ste14
VAFVVVIVAGEALPTLDVLAVRAAGVLLLLASLGLWIPPMVLLTRHGAPEPGRGFTHTRRLVTAGLYGWVRHPQYLGYSLLVAGFVLTGLNALSLGAGLAAILSFYMAARSEERYLKRHFGEPYDRYMSRVPRFDLVRGAVRRWRMRVRDGNPTL